MNIDQTYAIQVLNKLRNENHYKNKTISTKIANTKYLGPKLQTLNKLRDQKCNYEQDKLTR